MMESLVTSSSFKKRELCWKELKQKLELDEDFRGEIVDLMFLTLDRYHDRRSRLLVSEVLQSLAVRSPQNAIQLILQRLHQDKLTVGVKNISLASVTLCEHTKCLVLMNWLETLVCSSSTILELLLTNEKVFSAYFNVMSFFITCLGHKKTSKSKKHLEKFQKLLKLYPQLAKKLMEHYIESKSKSPLNVAIMGQLVIYLNDRTIKGMGMGMEFTDEIKESLLKIYQENILAGPDLGLNKIDLEIHLDCFKLVLVRVKHDDLKDVLLPVIQRSSRRTPLRLVVPFIHFLSCVTLDLGSYCDTLAQIVIELLSSSEVIKLGLLPQAIRYIVSLVSDTSITRKFLDAIISRKELWDHPEQRSQVFQGLQLCAIYGQSLDEQLALYISSFLKESFMKESSEDVQHKLLEALGLWLQFLPGFPDWTEKFFVSPSKNILGNERIKYSRVMSLRTATNNMEKHPLKLEQTQNIFIVPLMNIVSDFCRLHTHQLLSLVVNSIPILQKLQACGVQFAEDMNTKINGFLASPENLSFVAKLVSKLSENEKSELFDLWLRESVSMSKEFANRQHLYLFYGICFQILVYSSADLYKRILLNLQKSLILLKDMVSGIVHFFYDEDFQSLIYSVTGYLASEGDVIIQEKQKKNLQMAILACVPGKSYGFASLPSFDLFGLLMCCCHPIFGASSQLMFKVCKLLVINDSDSFLAMKSSLIFALDFISDNHDLKNNDTILHGHPELHSWMQCPRTSGLIDAMVKTIAHSCVMYPSTLPSLVSRICGNLPRMANFTLTQINEGDEEFFVETKEILLSRFFEKYVEDALDKSKKGEKERHKRGAGRMYSKDDEEWEINQRKIQIRKDLENKREEIIALHSQKIDKECNRIELYLGPIVNNVRVLEHILNVGFVTSNLPLVLAELNHWMYKLVSIIMVVLQKVPLLFKPVQSIIGCLCMSLAPPNSQASATYRSKLGVSLLSLSTMFQRNQQFDSANLQCLIAGLLENLPNCDLGVNSIFFSFLLPLIRSSVFLSSKQKKLQDPGFSFSTVTRDAVVSLVESFVNSVFVDSLPGSENSHICPHIIELLFVVLREYSRKYALRCHNLIFVLSKSLSADGLFVFVDEFLIASTIEMRGFVLKSLSCVNHDVVKILEERCRFDLLSNELCHIGDEFEDTSSINVHNRVFALLLVAQCDFESNKNSILAFELRNKWFSVDEFPYFFVEEFLIPFAVGGVSEIRRMAANAWGKVVEKFNETLKSEQKSKLIEVYKSNKTMIIGKSGFQHLNIEDADSNLRRLSARSGSVLCLGNLGVLLGSVTVAFDLLKFFLDEAINDSSLIVTQNVVDSAALLVEKYAPSHLSQYYDFLMDCIISSSDPGKVDRNPILRRGLIVLMNILMHFLDPSDVRFLEIISRTYVDSLFWSDELVQGEASNCLIGIIPRMNESDVEILLQKRLLKSLESPSFSVSERRGVALGVASCLKGLGIISLKKFDIINVFSSMMESKSDPTVREGGLYGFAALSLILGRLFEPYAIRILPKLLVSFGDNIISVRDAANEAAKAIMSQLSSHGVKLVLPALLRGLDDKNWRTKTKSIGLLGTMAFCSPEQLSVSLPRIIPHLCETLKDSHLDVQKASNEALSRMGSVVSNEEVRANLKTILAAFEDPSRNTKTALISLVETNFVHEIDTASLSLLLVIIENGLHDRNAECRKIAASLVSRLFESSARQDLVQYISDLIPYIKTALKDSVNVVRSETANSLKTIVSVLQGDETDVLIPELSSLYDWLFSTMLTCQEGTIERSGAAMGLAAFVSTRSSDVLEGVLEVLFSEHICSNDPLSREGTVTFWGHCATIMQARFRPFLMRCMKSTVTLLGDDIEDVREAALSTGTQFVSSYWESDSSILLPCLEAGLVSGKWRIQLPGVHLLGDTLFRLLEKATAGDSRARKLDETGKTVFRDPSKAMARVLGSETVHTILAALYLVRFDNYPAVANKAFQLWKTVVTNTPKTLREILPVIVRSIVTALGSAQAAQVANASSALGDLVEKLGDRILPSLVPILSRNILAEDTNSSTRAGICTGLSEVVRRAGKSLYDYVADIILIISNAFADSELNVRKAAYGTFDVLLDEAGPRCLDGILSFLLERLENVEENSVEDAAILHSFQMMLSCHGPVVLSELIPRLLVHPIALYQVRALAALAEVRDLSLARYLRDIIRVLLVESQTCDEINKFAIIEGLEIIAKSLKGDDLLVFQEELELIVSPPPGTDLEKDLRIDEFNLSINSIRCLALGLISPICQGSNIEAVEGLVPDFLSFITKLFRDKDESVLMAAWHALNTLVKSLKKETLFQYLRVMREVLLAMGLQFKGTEGESRVLPGFNIAVAKPLDPVLPIYLSGLMNGSPEGRELAAQGLGELVKLCSPDKLRVHVIQITGPLIRVVGDRFPWQVKAAILQTFIVLIEYCGESLKKFLPQLQTTFVRALNDPAKGVRDLSTTALGDLMGLGTRVDPLLNELLGGVSAGGILQDSSLGALEAVLLSAGKQASTPVLLKICSVLFPMTSSQDEMLRLLVSKALGTCIARLPLSQAETIFAEYGILDSEEGSGIPWMVRQSKIVLLVTFIHNYSPELLLSILPSIEKCILLGIADDNVNVRKVAAGVGASYHSLIKSELETDSEEIFSQHLSVLMDKITILINDYSTEVVLAALRSIRKLCKYRPKKMTTFLPVYALAIYLRAKDSSNQTIQKAARKTLYYALLLNKKKHSSVIVPSFAKTLDSSYRKPFVDFAVVLKSKIDGM